MRKDLRDFHKGQATRSEMERLVGLSPADVTN